MKKLPAQGFVANPLLIGAAIVVILIVVGIASGALKFSGYVKVDDQNKGQSGTQSVQSTPAPTEQPKPQTKLNTEPFSDSKYGYSISYPEGWKVKEQTSNVTIFKPSETKGPEQADALVSVVAGDLGDNKGMKLTTIADIHKTYLKKQFSNAEVIGEKEVKVGDKDGYELEFTGTINTEKMHGRYIVLKGDKYIFAIVGMANTGLWDSEKNNIEASIQTFKLQ